MRKSEYKAAIAQLDKEKAEAVADNVKLARQLRDCMDQRDAALAERDAAQEVVERLHARLSDMEADYEASQATRSVNVAKLTRGK